MKAKRQCRAAEIWVEGLKSIDPKKVCKKEADLYRLVMVLGTHQRGQFRGDELWAQVAECKDVRAAAWNQLYPLFVSRMVRNRPMDEEAAGLTIEGAAQAEAIGRVDLWEAAWQQAVAECPMPKRLQKDGVEDTDAVPA